MRVVFYGGRQAGAIALLTLLSRKEDVCLVLSQDEIVEDIAKSLNLKTQKPDKINSGEMESFVKALGADIFICVHGRKIVKENILSLFRLGGINVHPCLYKYKGAKPIDRLLADGETTASVGIHKMTSKVDEGEVLAERFINVGDCKTVLEVYNKLYPLYSTTLSEALEKLSR